MANPAWLYSRSLLRKVRIEMPRMFAACVRLPRQWSNVSRIRSRSTSATVRPTRPRVTATALFTACCTGGEQHGAMHRVLELAHVAAPRMSRQQALGDRGDRAVGDTVLRRVFLGEV